MVYFLAVIYLTFSDGSYVAWNKGKWDHAPDFKTCTELLKKHTDEMKVTYKDYEGSTFMTACIRKEEKK